jgi:hypothetical protein
VLVCGCFVGWFYILKKLFKKKPNKKKKQNSCQSATSKDSNGILYIYIAQRTKKGGGAMHVSRDLLTALNRFLFLSDVPN